MNKVLSLDSANIRPASEAGAAGVLALANENRFAASHYSEPLTEFVLGVLGTDLAPLQAELDLIAPPVRTPRRFEYKKSPAAMSFLADNDDERAIGASFRVVEAKGESVNAKTANRGLVYTIDNDEMVDGYDTQVAKWLTAILLRNSKRRAIALIDASATNTNVSFTASTDPDALIETGLLAAHAARGLYPNQVLCGLTAWSYRKNAYRSSTKAGALQLGSMTPQEVAEALAVDRFVVSKDVYKTSGAGSKSQFLANLIYAYFVDQVASKEDASNVKRFYTPCEGGQMIRVYTEVKAKTTEIMVEHYSTEAVVDSTGIRKFTAANS